MKPTLFSFVILNEALSLSFVILNVAQRNEESKKRLGTIEAFRCFVSLSMTKKGM
jgi:hypothetical protein